MWLVGGGWKVSTHNSRYSLWTLTVRVLIVGGQGGGWWAADTQTMQCQCPVCPVSQSQGLAAAEIETRQAGAGHTSAGAAAVNQWAFSHFLCRNDCHQLQAGLGWWGSAGPPCAVELQTNLRKDFTITEKAPTRAFSWLKALTSAFTFTFSHH